MVKRNIKKQEPNKAVQWAKFAIVTVLYLLFLYWVESWWGLLVVPFIYDAYISRKINWQWWRDSDDMTRFIMNKFRNMSIIFCSR